MKYHYIETSQPILEAEDGLILGNGDLSVSVYQRSEHIVWRFGKNDVWDRRLDLSNDPKPAHIDEIARGIRDEGWVSHNYRDGDGHAAKAVKDPERMKEVCGVCPSYSKFPYPCPKPVGELWMHIPIDKRGLTVHQKLCIETAELEITLTWEDGGVIRLRSFIHPVHNALVVKWDVEDWNSMTAMGHQVPVWFSVLRWKDSTIEQFRFELFNRARNRDIPYPDKPGSCQTLPAPSVVQHADHWAIEQTFYPDLEYADGFKYFMMPFVTDGLIIDPVRISPSEDKAIHLYGNDDVLSGWMCCAIPCSSDDGGCGAQADRFIDMLSGDFAGTMARWREESVAASLAFWGRSGLEMDDKVFERAWYETLYLRRCAYRHDVIAPGLALPSTVQDYSMWHGDYHMNFNYQQPFYGDYGSNHVEIGDSYFPGLEHMIDIGRTIAQDYWNCRGTFIALSGYPFKVDEDPFGCGPLSRLAYCTGWAMNQYWSHFLHTWDLDWLREHGYGIIRDCALFYLDFLELRDDGQYHAFPSVQGESFFTGRVEDYTDQPQVIRNARYCLSAAVEASELLQIDAELRAEWQERIDKLINTDEISERGLSEAEKERYRHNVPAFVCIDHEDLRPQKGDVPYELRLTMDSHMWRCSFNTLPWYWMIRLRNDIFDPETELDLVREHIRRWRMPSGHLRSMTASDHGYIGAYGESMGVIAPIQEMMLQSWDRSIRVFPAWPVGMNGKFRTLRAEGAFLVSGEFKDGRVMPIHIHSEKGRPCRVKSPWATPVRVIAQTGKAIESCMTEDGYVEFASEAGATYELAPEGLN